MAVWINLKDIADGAKFYAGATIKIMSAPRGWRKEILSLKAGLFTLSRTMLQIRVILTAFV